MNAFWFDFTEGFLHITDLTGYDHILYLISLCAIYQLADAKQVTLPVTAFAVAHTTTLALSAFGVFTVNVALVEFLIPVTILVTCVYNYSYTPPRYRSEAKKPNAIRSGAGFFFGLIHGLGFSNHFRMMMRADEPTFWDVLPQLLSFTLGIEIGQLVIVAVVLGASFLAVSGFGMKEREWNVTLSAGAGFISFTMAMERGYAYLFG